MKKIILGTISVIGIAIITYSIINNFGNNSEENKSETKLAVSMENALKNTTNSIEKDIKEVQVAIFENENETNNVIDIDNNDIEQKAVKLDNEKSNISNAKETTIIQTVNNEAEETKDSKKLDTIEIGVITAKTTLEVNTAEKTPEIKEEIQQEESNVKNTEQEVIKDTIVEKEDKKETIESETTEVKEETKTQEEINKEIAKEKMLNSILMPTENLYRQNGKYAFQFNKAEALRTASAIIDESFNYEKLWNGKELLFKIKIEYIEAIMQYSMYWPFKESAIINDVRNKHENGTFYIWAEDYIIDGEKVHTQYCVR